MNVLTGFILSMSVTVVLIPLLIRWAVPLRILDLPEARKVHASPVPRVGGIAMTVGILLALPLLGDLSARPMQALCLGIAGLLVFGVWDDRSTLSAAPKFVGQALAALIAIVWGGVNIGTLTLIERTPVSAWLSIPLTFFFLIGGTNAFNLADGLDGLAGGMATLCLCGTALLAYTVGNTAVGGAAVIIVGALIGFLRFNTHPARIFMGDGGSQVLGFSAALLALFLTQDPQIPLSTALPLLLLGMPIIDTLMVMSERLLRGCSPFLADRRHIHHRLLALGFEHWEAVSILYVLQGCLFIAAWSMRYDSDLLVIGSFAGFALLVVVPIRIAQRFGWRVRRGPSPSISSAASLKIAPRDLGTRWTVPAFIRSIGSLLLLLVLASYAVWVLRTGGQLSHGVQMLALGLAIMLGAGLMLRWRQAEAGWIDKVALYSCAALAIFASKHGMPWALSLSGGTVLHPSMMEYLLYAALAMALVICIRGSPERPFKLTPLDILVLLVVVTVPNLPDSIASARSLGVSIAELVLLFYSVEALSLAAGRSWRWLNGGAAVFLLGLALRAGL